MITIRSMFIASATIATVACGPTDVGNPIDVDFALYNTRNASSSRLDSTNGFRGGPGDITIQEAWIAVERVSLRDAVNCNGNAEVDLIGP